MGDVFCQNCGYNVKDPQTPIWDVFYGDRILVLKYLYLVQEPRRWDVVVFKTPAPDRNDKQDFATNFIKRLVGKPGETVMILDGDIYVSTADQPDWTVQTKPRVIQEALWRLIYNNDYYPTREGWVCPWQTKSGSGWDQPKDKVAHRTFTFDNPKGEGTIEFNPDANPGVTRFADRLAYDQPSDSSPGSHWYVSDLKLQFSYARRQGDGPLRAQLTKRGHTFTAEITPGGAKVLHTSRRGTEVIGEAKLDLSAGSDAQVEFQNVDYQVRLRINGRDVVVSTPEQYGPDVDALLAEYRRKGHSMSAVSDPDGARPAVSISAQGQVASINHLSLWRDGYYTPALGNAEVLHASPARPIHLHRAGEKDKNGQVCDNEYFVLGDNSILSSDARVWTRDVQLRPTEDLYAQSGCVPERFLLGKAFFVYWPAGFRPFSSNMPGIIPNFGAMRFIH